MCNANNSPVRTKDVPIIPHPHLEEIRALIRKDFEELRAKHTPQPGRTMLPEEK
jgi:hypothetical protein